MVKKAGINTSSNTKITTDHTESTSISVNILTATNPAMSTLFST